MTDSNQPPTISKQQIDAVIALYSNGQYKEAIDKIKALNETYPNVPFLFNLIGACYKSLGQIEGSAKMFQTAVNIKPDYAEAHKNLGIVLKDLGRLDESIESLKRALAINSNYVDAHYNLANIFKEKGQFDNAIKSYENAIAINPSFVDAHNNLGNLFKDLGETDKAIKSYIKAIEISPQFAHAHNNLGIALVDHERFDDAVKSYKKAIDINPQFAEAHNNLGNVFKELRQLNDAIKQYKIAISLNPNSAEALYNLGSAYKKRDEKEKALLFFEQAWSINSNMNFILGDLLTAKMNFCFWDNYHNLLSELKLKIKDNQKAVNPFNLLGFVDDLHLQMEAAKVFTNYQYPERYDLPLNSPYIKHPKIRIGYFSADFHNHATMHLMAELFELHDKSSFELIAFSFGPDQNDEWRQRASNSFNQFIDVRLKSDIEITLLARDMEIDIAIDLKGYTRDCRPNIFAQNCAPIQVSFLGYPGTSSADYIHYLIADHTLIPKNKQQYYSEKIVYMPNSYQVNVSNRNISKNSLSRNELGLPKTGFVFCCFNNNYKITISTFAGWMRILKAVNNSVLWLFENNSMSAKNLKKEALKHGINDNRLIFAAQMPVEEHLNRIKLADLFLDTLPYNAHTTSSDSLRMNVPVLTCIGQSFASRVAASIVNAVNLPELITHSQEE